MMHLQNIEISLATENDYDEILKLVVNGFILFDPLVNLLSISVNEFTHCIKLSLQDSIRNNLSLRAIATDDNNKLVGALISNDYYSSPEIDVDTVPLSIQNYLDFFHTLGKPVKQFLAQKNIPEIPGIICNGGFFAIDKPFFGTPIAYLMQSKMFDIAKERNFRFIISEYTNPSNFYIQKRALGNDFQVLNCLSFKDFKNRYDQRPMLDKHGEAFLTVIDIEKVSGSSLT